MCVLCASVSACIVCLLSLFCLCFLFFFFKQKTAYEMRISDWSSDVCSSDLVRDLAERIDGVGREDLLVALVVGIGILFLPALYLARPFLPVVLYLRRKEIGRASCRERVCQYV